MVRASKAPKIGPTPTLPICLILGTRSRRAAVDSLLAVYKKLPPEQTEAFLNDIAEAAGTGRCPAEIGAATWMTWDMLREMHRGGMTIGGHTVNHPILATLSPLEQEQEICGCARSIHEQLGEPMRYFSYPRGKPDAFNDYTRACLYEAQVQYGFSYYGGMNRAAGNDAYDLHRVGVEADTPMEHFEAMVTLPQFFA
jgi:peptidoglycan/xylan/chitin deacetylase (PgdA/CDA1 family)